MRITHVVSNLGLHNGIVRVISNLISYQLEEGHQVSIIYNRNFEKEYTEEFENKGVKIKYIPTKHPHFPFNYRMVNKYKSYLKNEDIVHVHAFPCLYWLAFAKILSKKFPKIVVTEHATENNRQKYKILKQLERFIYTRYDSVVAVTKTVADYMHRFIYENLKIEVVPNGIDTKRFHDAKPINRAEFGLEDDWLIAIQIGRLEYPKKQKTLIEAISILPEKFHAVLIGNGDLEDDLRSYAKQLGVNNRVHFLGLQSNVENFIKASDFVVFSSDFEGFGLAALEGMAAEVPTLVTDISPLNELVTDAYLLFPKGNAQVLSSQLYLLSESPEFYAKAASSCYHRALEYDSTSMAKSYEKVYTKVFSNNC